MEIKEFDNTVLKKEQIEELKQVSLPLIQFIRKYLTKKHTVTIDWNTITLLLNELDIEVEEQEQPNLAIRKEGLFRFFRLGIDNYPEWFSAAIEAGNVKFNDERYPSSGQHTFKVYSQDRWKVLMYGDVVVVDDNGDMDVYGYETFKKMFDIQ